MSFYTQKQTAAAVEYRQEPVQENEPEPVLSE
jgi:hypothetical protein